MNFKSIEEFSKQNIIALTGGIASGKSTIAKMIAAESYFVFDADKISREIVEPGMPTLEKIKNKFGNKIIGQDGKLLRAELGKIIFADHNARKDLEAIMHPEIRNELARQIQKLLAKKIKLPIFYEAALIFETNRQDEFREVWCVSCSQETQISRLMERNKIDRANAEKILSAQHSNMKKEQYSQVVINTDRALSDIQNDILKELQKLPIQP